MCRSIAWTATWPTACAGCAARLSPMTAWRSEEHTSELQSLRHLVCRLLLEKKKHNTYKAHADSQRGQEATIHTLATPSHTGHQQKKPSQRQRSPPARTTRTRHRHTRCTHTW